MSAAAPRPDMPSEAAPRADRPAEELPTRELLDRVVNEGYAGRSWDVLQDRLGDVALRDIGESISSGTIGRRCRSVGVGILCSRELEQSAWAEDLATTAVALTLSRLKDDILRPGLWDPARGQTLEHYFVACCLRDMANVYRKSLAAFRRHSGPSIDGLLDAHDQRLLRGQAFRSTDPADTVVTRDELRQALERLRVDERRALVLVARGWSRAEIARDLNLTRATLDTRLSRARRRLGRRGETRS